MKKLVIVCLVCTMLLALVACGGDEQLATNPATTKPTTAPSTTQTQPSTPAPTTVPTTAPMVVPTNTTGGIFRPYWEEAADFTVYDQDYNPVSLENFLGKPIVLNFWASWCGPCKAEMPDFQEAYETYGDQVQFVLINLTDGNRETAQSATAYVTQQGYTFPIYFDPYYSAVSAYGITSIPATFFIDAEGHVLDKASGSINASRLVRGIEKILE